MWEWGRGAGTGTEETGTTKAGGKGKQKTLPLAYGGHVPEPTLKNENISGECCKSFAPRCAKQSSCSISP